MATRGLKDDFFVYKACTGFEDVACVGGDLKAMLDDVEDQSDKKVEPEVVPADSASNIDGKSQQEKLDDNDNKKKTRWYDLPKGKRNGKDAMDSVSDKYDEDVKTVREVLKAKEKDCSMLFVTTLPASPSNPFPPLSPLNPVFLAARSE